MQKNEMALKKRVLIDGIEYPGLVACSEIKDEEGIIEAPEFSRIIPIKNGMKKLDPVTVKYAIRRNTNTHDAYYDWFNNDEEHDVTIICTDANGIEVLRWLLRDCELSSFLEGPYEASAPEYYSITCVINCTTAPVKLNAA